jgi:hypothetical protein
MLALLQNTLIVICKIWVTISYREAGLGPISLDGLKMAAILSESLGLEH